MQQFYHNLPTRPAEKVIWQNLSGSSAGLYLSQIANKNLLVVITSDILTLGRLEQELIFYRDKQNPFPILTFPDWETLPYDHFSPHQDIVSSRLLTLYQLPKLKNGILLVAASTLMHQLPPIEYVEQNSFVLSLHEHLNIEQLREKLEASGYRALAKVMEHGEFAVRGSIIDIFPMGSKEPYRIDLLDSYVDSIRTFDPDSQLSLNKINKIHLLPAKEYPLTDESVKHFRKQIREKFLGDPSKIPIYESVSNYQDFPGIEYYLSLFFAKTSSLFDYLPKSSIAINYTNNLNEIMNTYWSKIKERYDQLCHDQTHPVLPPKDIFIQVDQIYGNLNQLPQIYINPTDNESFATHCFKTKYFLHDSLAIDSKDTYPFHNIQDFIQNSQGRILFIAESLGRRENLLELLKKINVTPTEFDSWQSFINSNEKIGITIALLEQGLWLLPDKNTPEIIVITESLLFGGQVMQRRRRKSDTKEQDPERIVRDLTELQIGAPVVHIDYGIGRYLGLKILKTDNQETEFLILEYANDTKLYVPVSSLQLISRYSGIDAENAPLHTLGSKQWEKSKKEAQEKIRDVAAELLEIYAQRQTKKGFVFKLPTLEYQRFAASFPFEETIDQERAINDVINDMVSGKAMDRLICGDVGFGKTEVAMRAAFIAVQNSKQVAILVPTTLLAQQHFANFQDRFADWPIKIELLSRVRSSKDQKNILENLKSGKVDIVIGTHKLLQKNIEFKDPGLLIIDEEHRFGVKQKEHIKKLRADIDILTLTATPIPRTLNMAFANIRDFSIIATPPAKRLSIKTFVDERNNYIIKEAILREILRGGQVYFLHNDIATIEKIAREIEKLVPQAKIAIGHGQMHERELETVMRDFYHLRSNVLVCTTIIESGIDIPTANTMIIDRADKFGLAQLHQLRGRVGRSHHQAYAYLLTPPEKNLTPDAKKRLDAIASMEDLGAGFSLATHDLEIRGAGELLGEEQSGEIQSIGFNLYMELLERAVKTLRRHEELDPTKLIEPPIEVDLHIPALIPEKYLDDVNSRLVLYKRIANAKSNDDLESLQIEMIDRFGKLPDQTKNLFKITEIKLQAKNLGIKKIIMDQSKGSIEFTDKPNVDSKKIIALIQKLPNIYKIKKSNILEFIFEKQNKILFLENLLEKLSVRL